MTALEAELACEKENRNHLIEKGAKLETELAAAKAEAAKWKASHDNQVKLKSIIMSRPDLGDRAPRVVALMDELTRLRAELAVAENWVEHHSKHADDLIGENVKLRAEVKRLCNQRENLLKPMREQAIARAKRAEAALTEAIDGVIDGGSIPETLLVVHVPRSPVGYRVGQPVKVILPAIDAAMKGSK